MAKKQNYKWLVLRKDGQWVKSIQTAEGDYATSVLARLPDTEGSPVGLHSGDSPRTIFKMADLLDFVEGLIPDELITDLRKACKGEGEERLVFTVGAKDWDVDTHGIEGCMERMVEMSFILENDQCSRTRP